MNLKTLRELRGISRKELAKAAGVSFRSIQDYEQGHKALGGARADTVLRMAQTLDCSMEALLSEIDISSLRPSEIKEESWKQDTAEGGRPLLDEEKERLFGRLLDTAKPVTPALYSGMSDALPYVLMHKDREVASLLMEPVCGAVVSVQEVLKREHLPFGIDGGNMERAGAGIKSWWQRRAVPITQGRIRQILAAIGFETPQAYLLKTWGLSMEDCYWLRPANADEGWKDVSLFQNEFEDIVGAMQFGGLEAKIDFRNFAIRFPSASTGGDVPKAWVCLDDGKRLLVKGSQRDNTQQVFNEVVASYIHRKQGMFRYVDYQFYNIDYGQEQHFGISSEAFTNETTEFVPARVLIQSIPDGSKTDHEKFIEACVEGGLPREEVVRFLDYQILTDFVISNTDRSYDNFGVLRDADTLRFTALAPIFDSGNSMFYDLDMSRGTLVLKNIPVDSFAPNEVGLLKMVSDPEIVDLDRFLTDDEMKQVLQSSARTAEEVRLLIAIYNRKKGLLQKLKRGDVRWMQ